tara:strand:- start:217500 stop:217658 length:159 start_codon:yes stop_codon:yes gene_type:complete
MIYPTNANDYKAVSLDEVVAQAQQMIKSEKGNRTKNLNQLLFKMRRAESERY